MNEFLSTALSLQVYAYTYLNAQFFLYLIAIEYYLWCTWVHVNLSCDCSNAFALYFSESV